MINKTLTNNKVSKRKLYLRLHLILWILNIVAYIFAKIYQAPCMSGTVRLVDGNDILINASVFMSLVSFMMLVFADNYPTKGWKSYILATIFVLLVGIGVWFLMVAINEIVLGLSGAVERCWTF